MSLLSNAGGKIGFGGEISGELAYGDYFRLTRRPGIQLFNQSPLRICIYVWIKGDLSLLRPIFFHDKYVQIPATITDKGN